MALITFLLFVITIALSVIYILNKIDCKHEYEFMRNVYGDQINAINGMRSIWKCKLCNEINFKPELYKPEIMYPNIYKHTKNHHS